MVSTEASFVLAVSDHGNTGQEILISFLVKCSHDLLHSVREMHHCSRGETQFHWTALDLKCKESSLDVGLNLNGHHRSSEISNNVSVVSLSRRYNLITHNT